MSREEVLDTISNSLEHPRSARDTTKYDGTKCFEGEVTDNGFTIGYGSYKLSYGRRGLLPFLFGEIVPSTKGNEFVLLRMQIRPDALGFFVGLLLISFFTGMIWIGINRGEIMLMLMPPVFLIMGCITTIKEFNRIGKVFDVFIGKVFRGKVVNDEYIG